jgi:hypothetical protein
MMENVVVICALVGLGTVLANLLITALVFKLYTEYWKDITIKRRYEKKEVPKGETDKG